MSVEIFGRLLLDGPRGAFLGLAGETSLHAIHALKVIVPLERGLLYRTRNEGWRETSSLIVAQGLSHAIAARRAPIATFFLQPEAPAMLGVSRAQSQRGLSVLPRRTLEWLRAALLESWAHGGDGLDEITRRLVTDLRAETADAALDVRVARVLPLLWSADEALPLSKLAAVARISPDRFTHLFREQLGVSLRTYKAWVRFRNALPLLRTPARLTQLAHKAGFADAAHFSRTYRASFGLPASSSRKHVEFLPTRVDSRSVQVPAAGR